MPLLMLELAHTCIMSAAIISSFTTTAKCWILNPLIKSVICLNECTFLRLLRNAGKELACRNARSLRILIIYNYLKPQIRHDFGLSYLKMINISTFIKQTGSCKRVFTNAYFILLTRHAYTHLCIGEFPLRCRNAIGLKGSRRIVNHSQLDMMIRHLDFKAANSDSRPLPL